MKNKITIIVFLFILSISNLSNLFFAKKNIDIFNKIIEISNASTVEYGIRANFEIDENGEKYCLTLLKKLNLSDSNISFSKDGKYYSVDFKSEAVNGYIECSEYDNHNLVSLNIVKTNNENRLDELINTIDSAINKKDVKYFQYLKAKVTESDTEKLNNEIINMLQAENTSNISTVKLINGTSTVAYTKQFIPIKDNGKLVDLNFAVCSYGTGNYLIIGTPIIIEAY